MEVDVLKYPAVRNYIAGQFVADASARTLDVFSPRSGAVISTVPLSGRAALDAGRGGRAGGFSRLVGYCPSRSGCRSFTATRPCWKTI